MWRMQHVAGVLAEPEARVFLDAAGMMADELAEEMQGGLQTTYGVRSFDSLQPGQRLRLLAEVLTALLDEDVPVAAPTACAQGTVDAILNHVEEMVRLEVEYELLEGPHPELDIHSWRRVVQACTAGRETLPLKVESVDLVSWNRAIESLRERVGGSCERTPQSEVQAPKPSKKQQADPSERDCCRSNIPGEPDAEEIIRLWQRLRAHTHVESWAR